MNSIDEFPLLGNKPLFNEVDKYFVPLYQRAYSWNEKEIEQLIDDINDFNEDTYYLGSLVVYKRGDRYEVIDGQQRLTTLFILFNALELPNYDCLKFDCREKSNYTLSHLSSVEVEDNLMEETITNGKDIIVKKFNFSNIDKKEFIQKLSKVVIYRIPVPEHTDLNRYFEIMNTRGEQLEQYDILKASLMSNLNSQEERNAFAIIWDACSDMDGYVQMHFVRKFRDSLFGRNWEEINDDIFEKLSKAETKNSDSEGSIMDILSSNYFIDDIKEDEEVEERRRFESIIEFPYFLLHVLKVVVFKTNITNKESPDKPIVNELLDDKKLLDTFDNVLKKGQINGNSIDKYEFSKTFIKYLIKTRLLFDKCIIKREYSLNNEEGIWSIKCLKTSGKSNKKKPYYCNTPFNHNNEWEKTYEPRNKVNTMIQSCLRVSYTSPKIMHWMTELLKVLIDFEKDTDLYNLNVYAEKYARKAIKENFFEKCGNNEYKLGVNTPHIVFNYLDYLIWGEDNKSKNKEYSDFQFEFRNSVEHWYPQHPSDGTFSAWDDVNTFGNLCIIQRNVNSKFSNMSPEAKKTTFKEMISKGSLKLRIMAKSTANCDKWKNEICKQHEEKMIEILKKDLAKENL